MATPSAKRYLTWIVAAALFMEQLDSTILNTVLPAIAASLQVDPLSLKAAVTAYLISLALCLPVSGWMADRFGTRRVFISAIALFTLASVICGASADVPTLVAARVLQGMAAAMMVPVGRLMVVRAFAKSERLAAMNFVIVPALLGALLGPTVGGLVVHWLSWRAIFFVNVPIGLAAVWLAYRYLPDYRSEARRALDVVGLLLFGISTMLVSWLLGVFGDHPAAAVSPVVALVAVSALLAYVWHASRTPHPLLDLALFRIRTFRVSTLGGFVTRLSLGAMPWLLPMVYQLALGLPAWQAGLLMVPAAVAAMVMKVGSEKILARHGFRNVLVVNTVLMGVTIGLFSLVEAATPLWLISLLGLAQGLFTSLQFASMNSLAYADIDAPAASMASTVASTLQQMSMSFGLALASILTAGHLGEQVQSDSHAIGSALRHALLWLGALAVVSSLSFWTLRKTDGEGLSQVAAHRA